MLSKKEKDRLDEIRNQWKEFKSLRLKKKFKDGESSGWVSIVKRESFLDVLIDIFDRHDSELMA